MTNPFASLDATAQADLIRSGDASAIEVVEAAIGAAERVNGELNSIIHDRYDRARDEAAAVTAGSGPLAGVPIVLKELDGTLAGHPYHAGSEHLKRHGYVADVTSALFGRLIDAGAIPIGTTNTPELGLVPSTEPVAYGPTRNPWDTTRSPGGSSGGSAAAVAAGIVALGHAGDGGGSIRIPASLCGLVGLKPSRGRVSLLPEGEAWGGLVARLGVTRTVRDTALLLDLLAGPEPGDLYTAPSPTRPYVAEVGADPGALRVGLLTATPDGTAVDPECQAAVALAAAALEAAGHRVDEATDFDAARPEVFADLTAHFLTTWPVWVAQELHDFEAVTGVAPSEDTVEAHTWALAETGRAVSATAFVEALDRLRAVTSTVEGWFAKGWDLLVTPTVPELPWTLGQFAPEEGNPLAAVFRSTPIVPFAIPFNITGNPAISLPLHRSASGLPVGVQLVASYGREDLLLRVASQLEEALPWADARPGVWVG